jgi:hypothetical protein
VFQPTPHRPDAPPKRGTTWPFFLLERKEILKHLRERAQAFARRFLSETAK